MQQGVCLPPSLFLASLAGDSGDLVVHSNGHLMTIFLSLWEQKDTIKPTGHSTGR